MLITCDFDNTLAIDAFPMVGDPVPGAIESIKELYRHHSLILFTCREGGELARALRWLDEMGIAHCFDAYNAWPMSEQIKWGSNPRKIVGDINIDDKNCGCPLLSCNGKFVVNWEQVMDLIFLQDHTGRPVCGTRLEIADV